MDRPAEKIATPASGSGRPLRVCILAHYTAGGGGLSVATNLVPSVARAAPRHSYLITVQDGTEVAEEARGVPGASVLAAGPWGSLLGRWLWENRTLPRLLREFAPDVLLDLNSRGLEDPPCPQAILFQRAYFCYPPRHYARDTLRSKLLTRYHIRHLRRSLRRTALLLCQTTVAAERIRGMYGYEGRIEICPNAVSRFTLAGQGDRRMPPALAPHAGRFRLLCLTRYYAHKNLEIIPELFARFPEQLKDVAVFLTIAAEQHPGAARLLRTIRRRGLEDRVVNLGPLRQGELAAYYANCHAMFLPTLLESFSGTYLEAMHFGRPILTSDLDFAHVVCDDAAIYFDPWDAASVKDAILRLKDDPQLREQVVARGRARLETMYRSWEQVGADVAAALESIARPASGRNGP